MSLMASDAEEWACSGEESETPPLMQSMWLSMDSELICVLTKALEAPYSACVNPATSSTHTTVDVDEERGYSKLPP